MRKIFAALALGAILAIATPATSAHAQGGVPYDPSPIASVRTTRAGATTTTITKRTNGGSTRSVSTLRCRSGKCTLTGYTITVIVSSRGNARYDDDFRCTYLTRDPQNTNHCTHGAPAHRTPVFTQKFPPCVSDSWSDGPFPCHWDKRRGGDRSYTQWLGHPGMMGGRPCYVVVVVYYGYGPRERICVDR